MGESGRGFSLAFMRKSKLQKIKKKQNENYWRWLFFNFVFLQYVVDRNKKNPNKKLIFFEKFLWSEKLMSKLSKFYPNRWRRTVSFSIFQVILNDIDAAKIFKNLKLRVRYFFGTHCNILRGKKSKIVRVTFRSISPERPIYARILMIYSNGDYKADTRKYIGLNI